MKSYLITIVSAAILAVALVASARAPAASRPPRVVVDVSTGDAKAWATSVANVENLRKALGPKSQVEVVAYGAGIGMMTVTNKDLAERMSQLASAGVAFVACENTLRKVGLGPKDLLPFVTPVESGAAELIRKQQAGWSYLKPGG